jgi:hypothetical protein
MTITRRLAVEKVVAHRGDGTLLIQTGPMTGYVRGPDGKAWPERNIHAIIARGYWEPVEDYYGENPDGSWTLDGDEAAEMKRAYEAAAAEAPEVS